MSLSRRLPLVALVFVAFASAHATQDVTSMATTTTPGVPSSAEGYTYNNNQAALNSFTTGTSNYGVVSTAANVFVRRNAVNNNQSSIWYTGSGVGTDLSGIHQSDYGKLLISNNIFSGTDNTFANGTGPTTGNIERLDFTWNAPITINSSMAFAVFDRGAVGVHDSFAIAAVTAVDGMGNPTAFGSLLKVSPGWGGASNAIADFPYRLFRYANGNTISATTDSTATAIQGIGGIVITAADLGLLSGQNIYGYTLMAIDVTATNSTQLLDWTNGTYFPTTTDGNTGGGGIDLASVNGILFAVVPEPTPNMVVAVFFLFVSWCHVRRQRHRARV